MENEKKTTETNEKSINNKDYSKELLYLDHFKGLVDFNIFERSTYCEDNFYSTIAWYISCLQKDFKKDWEQQIQKLIDSLANFKGNEYEKIRSLCLFFHERKIKRYESNGRKHNANTLKLSRNSIKSWENTFIPNEQGKIKAIFPGIVPQAIPERYYTRFSQSGMESKVINENRKNFVDSMKKQREKADELTKKL